MTAFIGFFLCALIIFTAGKKLSHYGDLLADKTGMAKAMMGLLFMSAVTSLPELMVGISSSAIVKSADLAVGDILGSCACNLAILGIMDMFCKSTNALLGRVSQSHILAASLGIVLMCLAGYGLFVEEQILILPFLGLNSILFAVLYFVSIGLIFKYQKLYPSAVPQIEVQSEFSLKYIIKKYVMFAIVIVIAALFLPHFAEQIALSTGLEQSFVGSIFLAISTSLPEIAVSIAAVKMGAIDMAIGNLLGSNLFNMFILFLDDLFYTKGPILTDASDVMILSIYSVIIMSVIVIVGITFKHEKKKYIFAWDTFLILFVFVLNLAMLYKMS